MLDMEERNVKVKLMEAQTPDVKDSFGNFIVTLNSIGLHASVRYVKHLNTTFWSEIDTVMAATGLPSCQSSNLIRRRANNITELLYSNSLVHKFKGPGQKDTRLLPIENIIKLIVVLPGTKSTLVKLDVLEVFIVKMRELGQTDNDLAKVVQQSLSTHITDKVLEATTLETRYIYATATEALPGLIKIGRTVNVKKRIQTLNTSVAPKPHKVLAVVPTLDPKRDELLAHIFFNDKRVEGEFFQISIEDVQAFFNNRILSRFNEEYAAMASLMPDLLSDDDDQ